MEWTYLGYTRVDLVTAKSEYYRRGEWPAFDALDYLIRAEDAAHDPGVVDPDEHTDD